MTNNPSNTNTFSQSNTTTNAVVETGAFNAATGKKYFGSKALRLQEEALYRNYQSHGWATMKQWNSVKETIAKGEKGTLVIHNEKKPDGTEGQKRSFLFNRCQLQSYIAVDTGDKPF